MSFLRIAGPLPGVQRSIRDKVLILPLTTARLAGYLSGLPSPNEPGLPCRATSTPARFPPGHVWPEEMPADMAAAYVGEVSAEAFLAKVGVIWPMPAHSKGSRKKWSRELLLKTVHERHGMDSTTDQEPEDIASLI